METWFLIVVLYIYLSDILDLIKKFSLNFIINRINNLSYYDKKTKLAILGD